MSANANNKVITVVVVGYGFRGIAYSDFALTNGDKFKIVGVVDPNTLHVKQAQEKFGISDDMCFSSVSEFIKRGKIADCIINATMDNIHIETAIPLLELGYDMLLEKPITNNATELMKLKRVANENNCKLIICHVLRYTPFYVKVKELISSGVIGKLRHIEASENVGIPHASASYIRGKWRNSDECGSSYLLAKCCHDLDLLCWLNNQTEPNLISSMGGRDYFIKENAPCGSGTRCLLDCSIEKECQYSIGKMHVPHNPFNNYIWENYQDKDFSEEEKIKNLTYDNPHGECIFKTNANIVDQQVTTIRYKNGSTVVHTLFSGAPAACRRIHVYGDKGEIIGVLDKSQLSLIKYNPSTLEYDEEKVEIDTSIVNKGHAGGDYCIMEDLYNTLTGQERSISCTDIEDSINGHLCVFGADKSMEENRWVSVDEMRE